MNRPAAIIAAAFVAGCSAEDASFTSYPDQPPPGPMTCTPGRVSARDSIQVAMPIGHGHEAAIVRPDGQLVMVVFSIPGAATHEAYIIDPTTFSGMSIWTIRVGEVSGFTADSTQRQPIFQRRGRYEILVGRELENEMPLVDGWCSVEFTTRR